MKRYAHRILQILLLSILCLSLYACGGKETPPDVLPEEIFHTVTFVNGSSVFTTEEVSDGEWIPLPDDPTMESEDYDYRFLGWYTGTTLLEREGMRATENMTFVAQYEKSEKTVSDPRITFVSEGVAYWTGEVAYGSMLTVYPPQPVKDPSETEEYSFFGWFDEAGNRYTPGMIATKSTVFTARFTASPRTYTVTFKNWEGSTFEVVTVRRGESYTVPSRTPEKMDVGEYAFLFVGWYDSDGNPPDTDAPVTRNLVFRAEFDARIIPSVYAFFMNGDVVDQTYELRPYVYENFIYPKPPQNVPSGKTFVGWYDENGNKLGNSYMVFGSRLKGNLYFYARYQ